jgi:hypothetical protein
MRHTIIEMRSVAYYYHSRGMYEKEAEISELIHRMERTEAADNAKTGVSCCESETAPSSGHRES